MLYNINLSTRITIQQHNGVTLILLQLCIINKMLKEMKKKISENNFNVINNTKICSSKSLTESIYQHKELNHPTMRIDAVIAINMENSRKY